MNIQTIKNRLEEMGALSPMPTIMEEEDMVRREKMLALKEIYCMVEELQGEEVFTAYGKKEDWE